MFFSRSGCHIVPIIFLSFDMNISTFSSLSLANILNTFDKSFFFIPSLWKLLTFNNSFFTISLFIKEMLCLVLICFLTFLIFPPKLLLSNCAPLHIPSIGIFFLKQILIKLISILFLIFEVFKELDTSFPPGIISKFISSIFFFDNFFLLGTK